MSCGLFSQCDDTGNSLPRYIRASLTQIPTTASLLETSQLPLGLIINPFATPRFDEEPVPFVTTFMDVARAEGELDNDPNAGGPPRCGKCRGYVNPWCKWIDGGVKWMCNLCNTGNAGESWVVNITIFQRISNPHGS